MILRPLSLFFIVLCFAFRTLVKYFMSNRDMGSKRDCRVYIGNLPPDIRQRDLEDLFYKYGHINFIDVKLTRGAPFAFIEFDDPR